MEGPAIVADGEAEWQRFLELVLEDLVNGREGVT